MQALRFIRKLSSLKIGILLTSDSNLHSRYSKPIIRQKSKKAKYAFGMHGAFLDGGVVTSRSGSSAYHLSLKLKDNLDSENVSAAFKVFSGFINKLVSLSSPEQGLVIAPTDVTFNSNITEPYAHGEAGINIRYNDHTQLETVEALAQRISYSRKFRKKLDFNIRGAVGRLPMTKDSNVEEVYALLKENADILDILLREEHRWSSADICYAAEGKRIDGLGPVGVKPSANSEYIISHSLIERMALLALTLLAV